MKKFNLIAAVLAVILSVLCTSCPNDTLADSSNSSSRSSTTAVSNLKATAYEGAIVLTWRYNADLTGGFLITRTADGTEKEIKEISATDVKLGENYYVDSYGFTNQLVNGKSYKYTVYTLPPSSNVDNKSASASTSAKAIITKPNEKLEKWDPSEIKPKVIEYDEDPYVTWVVVTRPDSYAYEYNATLTVDYKYQKYNGDTAYNSAIIKASNYPCQDSTKKNGKDGMAKDYYQIDKSNWTGIISYSLSVTKSLRGTYSLFGFYKDSSETTVPFTK